MRKPTHKDISKAIELVLDGVYKSHLFDDPVNGEGDEVVDDEFIRACFLVDDWNQGKIPLRKDLLDVRNDVLQVASMLSICFLLLLLLG